MTQKPKMLIVVAAVLITFGLKFAIETAFPDTAEMFSERYTIAGVVSLFSVAIVWKLLRSRTDDEEA